MIMCIKKLTKFRIINTLHSSIHTTAQILGYLEAKVTQITLDLQLFSAKNHPSMADQGLMLLQGNHDS